MENSPPHDRLDETIHQRTRLAIMASLAAVDSLDFNELKALLALTDGNLSTHLSALEKAGYVVIVKTFRGKKPHTSVRMTRQGRAALAEYVELLRRILEPGK
jgi:DNA-binding transcriptional ArsR family regulator